MKYAGEWTDIQDLHTKYFMNGKCETYQHAEGVVLQRRGFRADLPIYEATIYT